MTLQFNLPNLTLILEISRKQSHCAQRQYLDVA